MVTPKNTKVKALKKEIGLLEAITMVVGVVIGSGIFFKASTVFKNAGSPTLGILAWVVGGVITIASALTVTEIATAIPKTGGVFAYLKELYSEKWAFLFGWVQALVYVPGVAAALSIVFVTQATYFIALTEVQQKLLAIFMIFFIMFINVLSTKLGSKVQFIATIAKLIPIFIIIVFGLAKGQAHSFAAAQSAGGSVGLAGFGAAILGTLWAYDGWVGVGNMAGELMTGVRIPFAMAQDNLFPFAKFFGKVNDRFETPLNAFWFEVILASLYVLSGSFETLTNLAVFVIWIFFVMTVAGIFILRSKHKHLERPYTVPFYPVVPIIGIAGGIYILISTLITSTSYAVYGIAITLIGLPVYFWIKKSKK